MAYKEWKKKRRDSFVEYLARDNELVEPTAEDFVWMCALVDLLIDDLNIKYSGEELEAILNDDITMLEKYIAFLETRLAIGNFKPVH